MKYTKQQQCSINAGIFEKESTSSILNALKKAIVAKIENGEVEICK